MITVTEKARDLLYDVLQQAEQQAGIDEQEDVAIRLAPTEQPGDGEAAQMQLGLGLDRPQDGDQVVEHNGKTVLLVDSSTGNMLDGVTLDAVDTPEGRQLTISQ